MSGHNERERGPRETQMNTPAKVYTTLYDMYLCHERTSMLPYATLKYSWSRLRRCMQSFTTCNCHMLERSKRTIVAMMADHENIETTPRNNRPPHDPLNLSDYQASDFPTTTSYAGPTGSAKALIWCDSMSRKIRGLLDAHTFDMVLEYLSIGG